MRANWGPGMHLTTACLPFLQGVGLRGMDSWAWHSDKVFSVPRQLTFSTQNPFFFDMRLNLDRTDVFFFFKVFITLKFQLICFIWTSWVWFKKTTKVIMPIIFITFWFKVPCGNVPPSFWELMLMENNWANQLTWFSVLCFFWHLEVEHEDEDSTCLRSWLS